MTPETIAWLVAPMLLLAVCAGIALAARHAHDL